MHLLLATMVRAVVIAMTALAGVVAAAPVVFADPAAQPQAGAPCDMAEPNAQTFAKPREGTAEPDVLIYVKGDQGVRWQQADGPLYPTDLNLGEFWDGVGATTNDICAEEQTFPGGRPSETRTNNTEQYFGFTLSPDMTSLNLKGNCHWVISPCSCRTGPSPCTAGYLSPKSYPRQRET